MQAKSISYKIIAALAVLVLVGSVMALRDRFFEESEDAIEKAEIRTPIKNSDDDYSEIAREKPQEVERIVGAREAIAASYAQLLEQADKNNAAASYQLFQDMSRCANKKVSREALENYAAQSSDSAAVENIIKQIAQDEKLCAGVTPEQLESKNTWVIKAARQGNTDAQLLFFGAVTEDFDTPEEIVANTEQISKYKKEALQHLKSAAQKGSDKALYNLAMAYHQGTLIEKDTAVAYGYMLALRARGSTQSANYYIDLWGRDITPEELVRARRIASQCYALCSR